MKRGFLSKLGIATAALGMGVAPAATPGQQQNAPQTKKDAVESKRGINMPINNRKRMDDYVAPSKKSAAGVFLNQRQYRKKCRQNPWLYKSKKHRSRN